MFEPYLREVITDRASIISPRYEFDKFGIIFPERPSIKDKIGIFYNSTLSEDVIGQTGHNLIIGLRNWTFGYTSVTYSALFSNGELPVGYFTNRVLSTAHGTSTLLALDFMCWRRSVGGDNSCMRSTPEIGVLSASGDLAHVVVEGRSFIIPTKPAWYQQALVMQDEDVRYIR